MLDDDASMTRMFQMIITLAALVLLFASNAALATRILGKYEDS